MNMVKKYTVNWNGEPRLLIIPGENIAAEVAMTDFPPLSDTWQAMAEALENPVGCAPLSQMLKPGSQVALLTGDRITDVMLGARDHLGLELLDYLNRRGVRDEDVTLVYAGGAHANPDWENRLGRDLLQRVRTMKHDPRDDQSQKFVGITSRCTPVWVNRAVVDADVRLAIGEISPTVHGGWCGGGKIILPGVVGMDTIQQNHHFVIKNINTLGLADGNHMRLDMEEAARLAGLDMKVDVLVNSNGQIVDVYAGDFVAEHRAALGRAREIWMTRMEPADIFVVYPGEGFERHLSSSFWIRLEGADVGLKSDGIIILVASAAGGWASDTAIAQDMTGRAEMLRMSTEELARSMVRKEGNIRSSAMLYSAKRVLEKRRVFLVCDGIEAQDAREFGFQHCTRRFEEALGTALEDRGKDARIAVNIQKGPVGWRTMPWREG
ncbi:MAG: lactate racemase domain-containing protein [Chloroflexota bacterium]|nr:lactate racemase domain-containing protein [Chloroflexota bacterium]